MAAIVKRFLDNWHHEQIISSLFWNNLISWVFRQRRLPMYAIFTLMEMDITINLATV